jgi:hypothetical protein
MQENSCTYENKLIQSSLKSTAPHVLTLKLLTLLPSLWISLDFLILCNTLKIQEKKRNQNQQDFFRFSIC